MKGLSFSEPMVKAWLAGNKDVTRRLINPQPEWEEDPGECQDGIWRGRYRQLCHDGSDYSVEVWEAKPRYLPGEMVYIKEKWRFVNVNGAMAVDDRTFDCDFLTVQFQDFKVLPYRSDWFGIYHHTASREKRWVRGETGSLFGRWRSPMFMPAWASRSKARIVSVRPERVQDITEAEAIREGMLSVEDANDLPWNPVGTFKGIWETIHPGSWERNDWVWRIELRREANHQRGRFASAGSVKQMGKEG